MEILQECDVYPRSIIDTCESVTMEQNIIIIIIIIITIMYIDGNCKSNPFSANTTWSDNKDALASDQMIYCDAVDDDSASNMLYLWPIDGTRCFTNAMFDLLVLSSRPANL